MQRRMDAMDPGEEFDLMAESAATASMSLMNEILGVATFSGPDYLPIFRDITRAMDGGLDPSRVKPGSSATQELNDTVEGWLERPTLEGGMVADLMADTAVSAMPMSYLRNTLGAVLNAGFSTTYASMGSVALLLLENPGLLKTFRDETVIRTGVHEIIRLLSPAQATARVAIEPVELGGVTVAAGDTIVTLMASANRDPDVFPDPDNLVPDRFPIRHLGFASGPHICLGAQLATTWIAEFVKLLVVYEDRLELSGSPRYMHSATLRNIEHLPVRVVR